MIGAVKRWLRATVTSDATDAPEQSASVTTGTGIAENASAASAGIAAGLEDDLARAQALFEAGAFDEAADAFERSIDLAPDCARAYLGQARAFAARHRLSEAADSYTLALAHEPCPVEALVEFASMLASAGEYAAAAEKWRLAVQFEPDRIDWLLHFAEALRLAGEADEADRAYRRILALRPDDVTAHVNLGLLRLEQQGRPDQAEQLFAQALAIDADRLEARANLGLALQEQGRFDEAEAVYEQSMQRDPGFIEPRWNRALLHLMRGEYEPGWQDYEARLVRDNGRSNRAFPFHRWHGEPLPGESLLVYAEQGLGDEIMFASCLPGLSARGMEVVLECNPRLERLFARSFDLVVVKGAPRDHDRSWLAAFPRLAAQVPIASLPMYLRRSAADFPSHAGYLRFAGVRRDGFRERLAKLGSGLKVGLSWRGGSRGTRSALRSIPFDSLANLLAVSGVCYVSLQHGVDSDERAQLAGLGVFECPLDDDLDDRAALIAALDLLITVDNTNAHLAGALGAPCWILLGRLPEWRWQRSGDRSPWYPSARLFRADDKGWAGVLANVADALRGKAH